MPKYIHEGRFSPPKTYKTGSVVETYPKPMLVLQYDAGGLDIVRDQSQIEYLTYEQLRALATAKAQPNKPITCVDLAFRPTIDLEDKYVPAKDEKSFRDTIAVVNLLRTWCPFKTVVVDPVTGLSDAIWHHQAVTNQSALGDPRKWAGNIGMKVGQVIDFINGLPCNSVFLFHSEVEKNDLTGEIRILPSVFSKLREFLGGKFSQFFYQELTGGKAQVRVLPFGTIQGIGARWPNFNGRNLIDADFKSIYGQEKDVYQ